MKFDELKKAAIVFNRINAIRNYVSKDRFVQTAKCRFGVTDERKLDKMYGLFNLIPKMIHYIANDNKEVKDYLPKALEIAEAAYEIKGADWDWDGDTLPGIDNDDPYAKDVRRYFYTENGESLQIDINLKNSSDIIQLSDLLQREGVKVIGVAYYIDELEAKEMGPNRTRIKIPYFDGDIYFLYGNPTDRLFYDWLSHGDDAGVYLATDKGWRKLLYTPTRRYIDKNGEIDFANDRHYSNYMLEASGKDFMYIGNIHKGVSVLRDGSINDNKELMEG